MNTEFLTEEEIWGDSALKVIKDYGPKAGLTDLAIILGGMMGGSGYETDDGEPSGYVWSASPTG